jgi:excisionase family DNA binding protein
VSDLDRLVTVDEACRVVGLGRSALYDRIASNDLRPVKVGRRTLFSQRELQAWIAARLAEREQQAA